MAVMEYKKYKKKTFKDWLQGENSKMYLFILLLAAAAFILIIHFVRLYNEQYRNSLMTQASESVTQAQATSPDDVIDEVANYLIRINRAKNFLTVYRLEDQDKRKAVKCFPVSTVSTLTDGKTKISSKMSWYKFADNQFAQFTCKLENGASIHTALYSSNNNGSILTESYYAIGTYSTYGSITLMADDAKWIYENCKNQTEVEIYMDESEAPEIKLAEVPQISTVSVTQLSATTQTTAAGATAQKAEEMTSATAPASEESKPDATTENKPTAAPEEKTTQPPATTQETPKTTEAPVKPAA